MALKRTLRDPIAADVRRNSAARRVGYGKCSQCGESRPEALIAGSDPLICARCKRLQQGKSPIDRHHVAGKANDPITIPLPVNDHRAEISVAQMEWPQLTLENRDGSPLLRAAATIRGFCDAAFYLIDRLLPWIAEMLERLDAHLTLHFGLRWWEHTELKKFAPKQ